MSLLSIEIDRPSLQPSFNFGSSHQSAVTQPIGRFLRFILFGKCFSSFGGKGNVESNG
jgi:hypothetical protein